MSARALSTTVPPAAPAGDEAAPRAPRVAPIGVVDIGSNSVRLVVFDGLRRVPLPLFNEKVLCGLGAGLEHSGRLNAEGVSLALETLARFAGLAAAMGVEDLDLLATAAVRDAANGADFVQEAERRSGRPIRVLSGAEEARLSAQGVLSGQPGAAGAMGDLGGGSLEVVAIDSGSSGRWATLPLGPLRLIDATGGERDKALALIDRHLEGEDWLDQLTGRDFYAVGGAWRALARIHMEQTRYPLHMVHGYCIAQKEAEELTRLVGQMGKRQLGRLAGLPRRRLETLPYAALLLQRMLQRARPARLVFSSFGLREGWLFDRLSEQEKRLDPLLIAAQDWAATDSRFGDLGAAIAHWSAPLFPGENEAESRLRLAACHLSDIGWRYHPDYRAEQVLLRILRAQELCVEHRERAFVGLALYHRYGSERGNAALKAALPLLPSSRAKQAEVLGRALRLAYLLSGGAEEMLRRSRLERAPDSLRLMVPAQAPVPPGTTIERRLASLASALEMPRSKVVQHEG